MTLLGAVLIVVSFLMPLILPPEAVWSDAKAEEFSQVSAKLHSLSHEAGHAHNTPNAEKMNQELAAVQARFDHQGKELDAATNRAVWPARICLGIGAVLASVGFFMSKANG
jgi:type IV secretory pathway TrbL component